MDLSVRPAAMSCTEHLVSSLIAVTGLAADFLRERGIATDRFLAELHRKWICGIQAGAR